MHLIQWVCQALGSKWVNITGCGVGLHMDINAGPGERSISVPQTKHMVFM